MRSRTISPRTIAFGLIGWLVATNILVIGTHTLGWWPFKAMLFICIALLPGFALLRIMRIAFRLFSVGLLYSFGLSLLVLMLSGLVSNQLLFALGVERPLDMASAFAVWNTVAAVLIAVAISTNTSSLRLQNSRLPRLTTAAWLLLVFSFILPVCATFGAWRLNNGGDNIVALITIGLCALVIALTLLLRRRLPNGLLVWLVFILGLSILLMTSMRGWDIVGHDLAREFRVFTLTELNGRWDITQYRDPYNACLSITILPQMFGAILGVSGLVVFKFILQIVFAACVAAVFLLLRQYLPTLGALIGSMLFICYPTFINDSAMLTRQGVAYLFFALAILMISNKVQLWRYKILFLLCALGAIVSHYSTAYMFVALFTAAVVCKLMLQWWGRRKRAKPKTTPTRTVLSPLYACLLLAMTFVWYAQITATSGGLIDTISKSVSNIPSLFSDENRSTDVSTALLFAGGKTQVDLYEAYLSSSLQVTPKEAADQIEYMPVLAADDLPVTGLGAKVQAAGINLSLTSALRQHFARFLQLLALAGVGYVLFVFLRKKTSQLNLDFICLSTAGIGLLTLMVILPFISVNYGVLRAFQQILIFLILPIMLLLVRLTQKWWRGPTIALATGGIIVLFLLFTGVFVQALGGGSPTLALNNQGLYHGLYYTSAADQSSFAWMKHNIAKKSDVRAANYNRAFMHDPSYPFNRSGILPLQTSPKSYVYLDHAQVMAKKFYIYYESSPLILTFPNDYYELTKNNIYSTPTTRVYR